MLLRSATRPAAARRRPPSGVPDFNAPHRLETTRVDHDEESIKDVSRLTWRRVGAFIHLPAVGMQGSTQQMVPINPADLDAALQKDHKQS